jgi:hypothetical protein
MPKRFADTLDALDARCGMIVESLDRIYPKWTQSARNNLASGLREPARELAEKLKSIDADADLSASGKASRQLEARAELLASIAVFKTQSVDVFRERIAQLEGDILKAATFTPPTDAAERLAYEMRAAELRAQLRDRDALEAWNIYLQAEDPEVRHIIETSLPVVRTIDGRPTLQQLVDTEKLENSRAERAMASAPAEQAELLEALRYCADAYNGAANILRAAILEDGGHELEASVADVAVGANVGE